MTYQSALLVLGNQLFPIEEVNAAQVDCVIMIEDQFLCRHFAYHQQKLVLVLAAMRAYAQSLRQAGVDVLYQPLVSSSKPQTPINLRLRCDTVLIQHEVTELVCFEVEGKAMQGNLVRLAQSMDLAAQSFALANVFCGRAEFAGFLKGRAKPQMASFYKFQRTRLKILVDAEGAPAGGRWSFDEDNRKKLPKHSASSIARIPDDPVVGEVSALVSRVFADHPGSVEGFHWPVTRQAALQWVDDFTSATGAVWSL